MIISITQKVICYSTPAIYAKNPWQTRKRREFPQLDKGHL